MLVSTRPFLRLDKRGTTAGKFYRLDIKSELLGHLAEVFEGV